MKAQRIEAFFYSSGMTFILGWLFLAIYVIAAAHGAYQYTPMGGFKKTIMCYVSHYQLHELEGDLLRSIVLFYFWTWFQANVTSKIPTRISVDDIMPKYHRYVALTIIDIFTIIWYP
jgi:hypothetical protein